MEKWESKNSASLFFAEKDFDILFKNLYPPLCGFANRILSNLSEAEELVQDVFVNLWLNQSRIIIQTSIKAYLYQMVHNAAINRLEHLRTQKNQVNKVASEQEWLNIHMSYSVNDSFLEILESKETEARILKELEQLPDKCREIFLLSRYRNLTNAEISKKLNLSQATVRVQLFRALNHLRKAFQNTFSFFLFFL